MANCEGEKNASSVSDMSTFKVSIVNVHDTFQETTDAS